jgi:hypothetical protein
MRAPGVDAMDVWLLRPKLTRERPRRHVKRKRTWYRYLDVARFATFYTMLRTDVRRPIVIE